MSAGARAFTARPKPLSEAQRDSLRHYERYTTVYFTRGPQLPAPFELAFEARAGYVLVRPKGRDR